MLIIIMSFLLIIDILSLLHLWHTINYKCGKKKVLKAKIVKKQKNKFNKTYEHIIESLKCYIYEKLNVHLFECKIILHIIIVLLKVRLYAPFFWSCYKLLSLFFHYCVLIVKWKCLVPSNYIKTFIIKLILIGSFSITFYSYFLLFIKIMSYLIM